ncbi:urea amidolyase family protein (plasmid) [Thioclava litoralis]|uniref:Urea amidolyase family protein n=1 Tax=Thioclava litoralis TaxID=3076557 RepID=A0ABZ1E2W1_9RHOB|nr:urea amidolyase family protein [Thioclava sp. FTW29]
MSHLRFLPVALDALLVELADLEQVLTLHALLREAPLAGLRETIPAARTLFVRFDPQEVSAQALAAQIDALDLTPHVQKAARVVTIPTRYDGEDLAEVAELTGLSVAEVIERHQARPWTVAFCGFAPGFGYMAGGDPALEVPRRRTPRTRIPAGSVALAGAFSGIYPKASPGGWQIIGTTDLAMWDLGRTPPALLQPGDQVQFERHDAVAAYPVAALPPSADMSSGQGGFEVLAAPFPAMFEDNGRAGQAAQGVAASGVLDRGALRALNRMLGNPAGTAALEITGGGFAFRAKEPAVIAVTGAPCRVSVNDWDFGSHAPIAVDPGDRITLSVPKAGLRALLGVRGGFAVAPVMGAATWDSLAEIGPQPVRQGAHLALAHAPADAVGPAISLPALPKAGDLVVLDVVMGPRSDWFEPQILDRFTQQEWEVTAQSSRVGIRLNGAAPLTRPDQSELPSEGTATGAIQVPHSGQPVLFLADHPLTGGYPVIGAVADYHLDLAGQLPPGVKIRFNPVAPFAEIKPCAGM